jgi:signal transduction histidine kinase
VDLAGLVPRLARRLTGPAADGLVALGLAVSNLALMGAGGDLRGAGDLAEAGAAVLICGCVAICRTRPRLAAAGAGAVLGLAALGPAGVLPNLMAAPVALLAFALGAASGIRGAVAVLIVLGAGLQVAAAPTTFNPFLVILLVGPWATGLVVRSRRTLARQLAARGRELAAERALFAAEAVRYERARIARELHDIVAHCVSVMVIQAGAGQRLAGTDPALAGEAFDAIGELASQAGAEIGRLVELLGTAAPAGSPDGVRLIGGLAARAAAAGLAVTCRVTDAAAGLAAPASDAAYRVVQESLTNALKHAPGAAVEIEVAGGPGAVEILVRNGPAAGRGAELERSGGGRGLAGMRERVAACGGQVTAGPISADPATDGGWLVRAWLPR